MSSSEIQGSSGGTSTLEDAPAQTERAQTERWAPPSFPPPASLSSPPWPPSPPWQAPSPTGSKGKRFLIGVAVFLGVIAIFVGVIAIASMFVDDQTKTPKFHSRDGKDQPKITSPTAGMSQDERFLYRHGSYYDCAAIPRSAIVEGAVAGIKCDASKNGQNTVAQKVSYYRFADRTGLGNIYSERLASLQASESATVVDERGWCLTSLGLPCFASDGRAVFYEKGNQVRAEWTYFPLKTYSIGSRSDGNMSRLRALWRESGPD